ncbi:MAG: NAD-dependent epimerase/dehydratase family protein [Muribaculaceae bacterium]|nr:NAD-dependent epimerase/dehydratase family protein [Roseburia sp.]MCM1432023.1 NAD-dependent epimerase/dehydratase family protein [Muribaculaceae bacterium]MCM1493724.1 NAD-dependent epimerase/dehydratase family protein [Muribaculaceae bacterium]
MKRILITGANSYIGISVESWLKAENIKQGEEFYFVNTLDMYGESWKQYDFSGYDVVFHVAGLAHADTGHVTEEKKEFYYKINTDLVVKTAEKAKTEGVKQFIFMSSMIIYGGCKARVITQKTSPRPANFYGESKWKADVQIQGLADKNFRVVILRPPMIYGKGSKGNYPRLAKLATKTPLFPKVHNQRSMLYIDNLCQFVKLVIDNEESGVFFPQNGEYTNTSELVRLIALARGHRVWLLPGLEWLIKMLMLIPGKYGAMAGKIFGDSIYEMEMSEYKQNYRVCDFKSSIKATEEI